MGLPSFVKKLIVGILIALAANFLLKGTSYSQFVFLVGLAIAGFPGTIVIWLTPLQSVLTGVTVGFWTMQFPLLYIWVAIDLIDFIMHIPILSSAMKIFTLGVFWIIASIPWLIKIGLILWFAGSAVAGVQGALNATSLHLP